MLINSGEPPHRQRAVKKVSKLLLGLRSKYRHLHCMQALHCWKAVHNSKTPQLFQKFNAQINFRYKCVISKTHKSNIHKTWGACNLYSRVLMEFDWLVDGHKCKASSDCKVSSGRPPLGKVRSRTLAEMGEDDTGRARCTTSWPLPATPVIILWGREFLKFTIAFSSEPWIAGFYSKFVALKFSMF